MFLFFSFTPLRRFTPPRRFTQNIISRQFRRFESNMWTKFQHTTTTPLTVSFRTAFHTSATMLEWTGHLFTLHIFQGSGCMKCEKRCWSHLIPDLAVPKFYVCAFLMRQSEKQAIIGAISPPRSSEEKLPQPSSNRTAICTLFWRCELSVNFGRIFFMDFVCPSARGHQIRQINFVASRQA